MEPVLFGVRFLAVTCILTYLLNVNCGSLCATAFARERIITLSGLCDCRWPQAVALLQRMVSLRSMTMAFLQPYTRISWAVTRWLGAIKFRKRAALRIDNLGRAKVEYHGRGAILRSQFPNVRRKSGQRRACSTHTDFRRRLPADERSNTWLRLDCR